MVLPATLFALLSAPLLVAQLETEPESPSPLTEGAARIFDLNREAADAVAANFDTLWSNVLQGGLYQAVADVGVIVAVLALGLFLVQWAQQLLTGDGNRALTELIWPLIVITFLSNDGALLGTATLELRGIGNQINSTVLETAVATESLQQQYQQTRLGSAIDDALSASIAECLENRPERQQPGCLAAARRESERVRQQYGLEPAGEDSWLGGAIQYVVRNLLWALHHAFQWLVEIVLLLVALLGPLAMGLSLLPTPAKPIISWLTGIAGVFLIKLNFNLISGLAAYAVSLQELSVNSLVLPVLLGLLAPVLAVLIGIQGGSALFNALSTVAVYTGYRSAAKLIWTTAKKGSLQSFRPLRRS